MKGETNMSYNYSTDPQSVAGPAGVSPQYTNHAGINANAIKSTGPIEVSSTGSITLVGDIKLTDAVEAVVTTTGLGTTPDLDNNSYQSVTSTSGDIKKYLLETPVAGVRKTILVDANGLGDVYIYASASSAVTAYFGAGTSQNIMQFTTPDQLVVELIGHSTAQWLISGLSTLNNGTTGSLTLNSSNT